MYGDNRVGVGDLLGGDRAIKYGHLVHCPQVRGNLANHGNGNINGSSKLDSYCCSSYYSSYDDATACTTSNLGFPQVMGNMLFSSFILTPSILAGGTGSASGDNSAFDSQAKSESIAENYDLISRASLYANQKK